jgi:two-component system, OmpR family, sensor kinase
MTLRARLVAALLVLLTAGLVVFGYATYRLYADAQYDELDGQLDAAVPRVRSDLLNETPQMFPVPTQPGLGEDAVDEDEGVFQPGDLPDGADDEVEGEGEGQGGPPPQRPPAFFLIYGELWDDGTVVSTTDDTGDLVDVAEDVDRPDIPDDLSSDDVGRYSTTGSVGGSTEWRVYVTDQELDSGQLMVLAVPTSDVRDALNQLVLIEAMAATGLLAILAAGAWLILRRGLRPLERMATTAHGITTVGELDTRVAPADDRSEIGQLGLALNTMLSRLQDAFAEQERTEARLRQFLADAAHELRTPLTSIQGFAELFRLGADQDPDDVAVSLRRIEEESGRMRSLVDDLLLLARLDQTRPVERVPVDLAVLAADACSDAAAADPDRPITLDAAQPVVVPGDRDHLLQAVSNLVANAVRHTPPGTAIEVAVRPQDGAGVVVVRDHGAGLDDGALAHAFDRFWQADPSRADAGAGLGLSIVAGIAAEHGGAVTANNARDGGAVFALSLPVLSESSASHSQD